MLKFSYPAIDRQSQIRPETERVEEYLCSKKSRFILWFEGKLMSRDDENYYFGYEKLPFLQDQLKQSIYLGEHEGQFYFTCQLTQQYPQFESPILFDLRSASLFVTDYHLGLLFYSHGLLNWHRNHQFCSMCGSQTRVKHAGHVRQCQDTTCAQVHYPSISPAVIFSIINDSQSVPRILLARQAGWDEFRYSVIAGFVEPGESLEDAVKREAYEETGLAVSKVRYVDSQPWPFPGSIMIGFSCKTHQQDIRFIDQELETAAWYSADEIESKLRSGEIKMPFRASISWYLIDRWFTEQKGYSVDFDETPARV